MLGDKHEPSEFQPLIEEYQARGGKTTKCPTVDTRDELRGPMEARRRVRSTFQPRTITETLKAPRGALIDDIDFAYRRVVLPDRRIRGVIGAKPIRERDVLRGYQFAQGVRLRGNIHTGFELSVRIRGGFTLKAWRLPKGPEGWAAVCQLFPTARRLAQQYIASIRDFRDAVDGSRLYDHKKAVAAAVAREAKPVRRALSTVPPTSEWRPATTCLARTWTGSKPRREEKIMVITDRATGLSNTRDADKSEIKDFTSPLDHLFRDANDVVFLTPDEEARLLETVRTCADDTERQDEYSAAKAILIKAYTPKILKQIRKICKNWPDLRIDEVYSYIAERLSGTRLNYYNHNRGRLATYLMQVVGSLFKDYTRTLEPGEEELISINKNVDCGEDEDESTELGDLLSEEEFRGYDENTAAIILAHAPEILTEKEYQVFVGYRLEEKLEEDLAQEMGVSIQRISQLKNSGEAKLKDYITSTYGFLRCA